ncbi:MAG: hypothetical protein RL417_1688 [Pseudomonadota bacterium]|jgi:histidyl-tRNA synthetase
MKKIGKISGFPEWLPEQRLVEEEVINTIRGIYRSHGFTPIETPAVELLSTLLSQGVVDKEIFVLRRAQDDGTGEAELGLHFDLTVPFARYVAQHFGALQFPFKRYQLQKVWRGDRPQKGRFREFYQFDIDVVAQDTLPIACDAEVFTVLDKAFAALRIGAHQLKMNSRKILLGFYASLGLGEDAQRKAVVAVDKIAKIGPDGVRAELEREVGIAGAVADRIIECAGLRLTPDSFEDRLRGFQVSSEQLEAGIAELKELFALLSAETRSRIVVDLSLARGLAYYTGAICEVHLVDFPDFGSVGGGGRYENLTQDFVAKKLPAVGASIGLSRLMDLIFTHNLKPVGRRCPTDALVAVYNEEQRPRCDGVAEELRAAGINVEVFYKSVKLGKQIDYADGKGIPFVIFINADTGAIEARNLSTREQSPVADIGRWAQETFR